MTNNIISFVLSSVLLAASAGCASGPPPRSRVVMTVGDAEAHVRFATSDVEVGDRVTLLKRICVHPSHNPKQTICEQKPVAEGVVTGHLDARYATVEFPSGTSVSEGDQVEPLE